MRVAGTEDLSYQEELELKEAEALPVLAAQIATTLSACAVEYEIVFVNDGSPDDSLVKT